LFDIVLIVGFKEVVEVLEMLGFVVEADRDLFKVLELTDDELTVNAKFFLKDGKLSSEPGVCIK
jgi:hypothetical protein